jgi:small subunit ribosomal protein S20
MPNNRNAEKAMRQANKRRLRNRAAKSVLRTAIKTLKSNVAKAEAPQVASTLNATASKIDKLAAKKFIHPNKAARLKSRLSKLANQKATAK